MKKIYLLFVFTLLIASCSNNVDVAIDNPTNEAIIVSIDSLSVEVAPKEVVWVEMGKGPHTVTLANDSIVNYDFVSSVYMLNPTMVEYLMTGEYYGNETYYKMYEVTQGKKKVEYLGMEFEGDYAIIDGLINEITWDYGPREVLPEIVEIEDGDNYTVLKKLYSPYELYEQMLARQESAN